MTGVLAVRVRALLVGTVLSAGLAGCAAGTGPADAALPPADAAQPDDAVAQVDAAVQRDAALQQDAAVDTALQQDAPRDTAVQQDAQRDALPPCTSDDMCNPDGGVGGRYCFLNKGACYTPGTCSSDAECRTGAICKPLLGQCSCDLLALLLCRDYETCVPLVNTCDKAQ